MRVKAVIWIDSRNNHDGCGPSYSYESCGDEKRYAGPWCFGMATIVPQALTQGDCSDDGSMKGKENIIEMNGWEESVVEDGVLIANCGVEIEGAVVYTITDKAQEV